MQELPAILQDYLQYLESIRNLSDNTVQVYFYELRLFHRFLKYRFDMMEEGESIEDPDTINIKHIDEMVLNRVTLRDLHAYINYADSRRDNETAAKARKVSSVRTYFHYLHHVVNAIDQNPAEGLELPKRSESLPVYLSLEESKKLLEAVNLLEDIPTRIRDRAIVLLFLNTGMRVAELCAMNLTDYHRDNQSVRVTGKGNKVRELYLHPSTAQAIEEYLAVRPELADEEALFISRKQNRYSTRGIQYMIKRYVEKAGLDPNVVTVHKLRHTAATFMYIYGDTDLRSIQEILGHANITTTQIYTHVSEEKKRALLESFPLGDDQPHS